MEECIFCKIIRGELPCHKIYEDEKILAFLDINPISKGHTLIIPKEHYVDIFDIPKDLLKYISSISQKLSKNHMEKLKADGINILQSNKPAANQVIIHYHIHVIPRYNDDGIILLHGTKKQESDLKKVLQELT